MPTNAEIAAMLWDFAGFKELNEDNPYSIAAFRRAAKTMENWTGNPLSDDVSEQKGIGPKIAAHVVEAAKTGRIGDLERLRKKFPDVGDLTKIPGVGLKRGIALHTKYGVTTRADLIAKLEADEKRDEKLLANVRFSMRAYERWPRLMIKRKVAPLVKALRPLCDRLSFAGSMRRKREDVKDVDILVTTRKPQKVLEVFHGFGRVETGTGTDQTKSSIFYEEGAIKFRIDLLIVPAESWGAALLYFTGSKDANVAMRIIAKRKGLTLNEYGLFKADLYTETGTRGLVPHARVAGRTEKGIYKRLGLEWTPPELRESADLYDGKKRKVPKLVKASDLRCDLHLHTSYSDGKHSVEAMVKAARDAGISVVGISDHVAPSVYGQPLMKGENVRAWAADIAKARKANPDMTILVGAEVDVKADGSIVVSKEVEKAADYFIASCHHSPGSNLTKRFLSAMKHPKVKMLGHPTGRALNSRVRGEADWTKVLTAAARRGIVVEVNGQPPRLDAPEDLVRLAIGLGCKIALNSDAHGVEQIKNVRNALDVARRAGCTREHVLTTPADVLEWLGA